MTIVEITKEQAQKLSAMGFKFHKDIMTSKSRYKKYYAKESKAVLSALEQIKDTEK